jgi:DNA replication protein DnaC
MLEKTERILGQFPSWPGARLEHPAFIQRLDERLLRFVRGWKPAHGSVAIIGETGCGKTSAVSAMAHRWTAEIIERGVTDPMFTGLVYLKSYDIIQANGDPRLGTVNEAALRRAEAATVLVLDELGGERSFADCRSESTLFELLDRRYDRCRPTIVTTGLRLEALANRYGAQLARRLTDKGVGTLIDLFPRKKLEAVG